MFNKTSHPKIRKRIPPVKSNILGDILSQIQAPNKIAKDTVPIKAIVLPINIPYKS